MKTTIEEINRIPHTVVWHDLPENAKLLFEKPNWVQCPYGYINVQHGKNGEALVTATALPPLPRNPTADDAELLYLYEANGICIAGNVKEFLPNATYSAVALLRYVDSNLPQNVTITHAINKAGERVEIAIVEGKDND